MMGAELALTDSFNKIDNKGWGLDDSIALAAKFRSLIYIQMAKQLNLTYIPSATRGYNSKLSFNSPSVRNLLFKDAVTYKDFRQNFQTNSTVISGIVVRNGCAPMACLYDTLDLRKKTKDLRRSLTKKSWPKKGDALLIHQYAKIKELEGIMQEYARKGNLIFDTDDLNPTLSADSIQPEIELSVNIVSAAVKVVDHIRRKRIANKAKALVLPTVQANFSSPSKLLKLLKQNAGLNE